MATLGKKILSAFIEVNPDKEKTPPGAPEKGPVYKGENRITQQVPATPASPKGEKFREYFDQLFRDANIPGPDYYEFSKMIEAMQAIPDEHARYVAAYAGLQVQGLDRQKLLSTAAEYLRILESDAAHFRQTVDAALQEKVQGKRTEKEEKVRRIQALTNEIGELQKEVAALDSVIKENEEKIEANTGGYTAESGSRKSLILEDIEKINHYIH